MDFDNALSYLGDFGKYQRIQYLLLVTPGVIAAMHTLSFVFTAAIPEHRCFVPSVDNSTDDEYNKSLLNHSIPIHSSKEYERQCLIYNMSTLAEGLPTNISILMECDKYVFDKTVYEDSIVSEFGLVCQKKLYREAVQSIYMAGILLGGIICGYLSDRLGRKIVLCACNMLMVVAGIVCAFCPDYYSYAVVRLCIGVAQTGVFLSAFVISMELIGPSWRTACGVGFQIAFSIGYVLVGVMAYFIRSWMWLQIAVSLPSLLFVPYWWLIPESVRWALAHGHDKQAEDIVRRASFINNVVIPESVYNKDILDNTDEIHEKPSESLSKGIAKAGMLDLFRTPNMAKKSINIIFNWFVNSLVYYGLSLNASNLSGDLYVNFILLGAVELPALIICIPVIEYGGRRLALCSTMIAGGVSCIAAGLIGNTTAVLILVLFGKMCISASFAVIYNFSAELFPTVVRNSGMGVSSTSARVGGIIAPLTAALGKQLPIILFGTASLAAGLLALLLPETKGKRLPETLKHGESFGKRECIRYGCLPANGSIGESSIEEQITDLTTIDSASNSFYNNFRKATTPL